LHFLHLNVVFRTEDIAVTWYLLAIVKQARNKIQK
jgi:hypothetical protein